MDEQALVHQVDLRGYLRVLRRRKWFAVVTTAVVVGGALGYSFHETPIYAATASVLVPQQQVTSVVNQPNSQNIPAAQTSQRALADAQVFARGDSVKTAAAKTLGRPAKVSVGVSSSADLLTFTAHSRNRAEAPKVANAYAKAYLFANKASQVGQYTEQITALQTSIAQQQKRLKKTPAGPQRTGLINSILSLSQTAQQVQAESEVVSQVGPTIVTAAGTPSTPISPKTLRNGLLGLVVGILLGLGLALLAEHLDDGISSREVAEQASGLTTMALIPLVKEWRSRSGQHIALIEDPTSAVSESYRTLRTALQFMGIDEPKRVIGLTSSLPGEGKTTAIANLAVSLARAGQRVIVVSCDLRRPRLHEYFEVSNKIGLTSVLIGQSTLVDAVKPATGVPRLRVLPAGPIPPNPAEVLSLERVHEVIEVLTQNSDIVLLDCPPVLPVTDTMLISRLVDGMLVLASAKSTSTRELKRTVELLRQVQTPLLGIVLNQIPVKGAYEYGYGAYVAYRSAVEPDETISTEADEPVQVPAPEELQSDVAPGGSQSPPEPAWATAMKTAESPGEQDLD
jgi:capsular exopolysaccharide synthesis family protein